MELFEEILDWMSEHPVVSTIVVLTLIFGSFSLGIHIGITIK